MNYKTLLLEIKLDLNLEFYNLIIIEFLRHHREYIRLFQKLKLMLKYLILVVYYIKKIK